MFESPEQRIILRLMKWMQNERICPTLTEIRDKFSLTNTQAVIVVSKLAERGYLMPLA